MRLPFSRRSREHARLDEPFPDEWRAIIERNVAHWQWLDEAERTEMEDISLLLVVDKRWEAARGFTMTDEVRVTIAAQAALLVLAIGYEAYRGVGSIIVHPTTMVQKGERGGPAMGVVTDSPVAVLGVAHYEGPVLIAWDEALANARYNERGHNVVYHEFAHKIDMLDHVTDGTPPLETDEQRARWVEVCTREFTALRNGTDEGLLRGYAATNPAEFFAVATEVFFDQPVDLEQRIPDLYEVLSGFYRQDPATRARRSGARALPHDD